MIPLGVSYLYRMIGVSRGISPSITRLPRAAARYRAGKYFRPAEVEQLLGDPTKAKTLLGWNPRKTSFEELVKIMVKHDMKFVKKLHLKASC